MMLQRVVAFKHEGKHSTLNRKIAEIKKKIHLSGKLHFGWMLLNKVKGNRNYLGFWIQPLLQFGSRLEREQWSKTDSFETERF